MAGSILIDIKQVCGLEPDDPSFDRDLILAINSELSILNQVGIGPELGFMIESDTATWDDFIQGELRLNLVKTYLSLKVRLLFDPPTTSYLIAAYEKQADMYLWRIREYREGVAWTPPISNTPVSSTEF